MVELGGQNHSYSRSIILPSTQPLIKPLVHYLDNFLLLCKDLHAHGKQMYMYLSQLARKTFKPVHEHVHRICL